MIDKVQKIRNEVERLQHELIQEREKGYGSDADDACILELQNVLTYIDSLQEEPVSDDLDEAAIQYCGGNKGSDARVRAAFVVGAKWQEEQSIRAVEIAGEEVIEKAQDWIADTFKYDGSEDFNGGADDAMSMLLDEFTKYMEE